MLPWDSTPAGTDNSVCCSVRSRTDRSVMSSIHPSRSDKTAIIPDRNHAIAQKEYAAEKILDGLLRTERDRHADDSDAGKRRGEVQARDRQQAEHGDQRQQDFGDALRQQQQRPCACVPSAERHNARVLEAQ